MHFVLVRAGTCRYSVTSTNLVAEYLQVPRFCVCRLTQKKVSEHAQTPPKRGRAQRGRAAYAGMQRNTRHEFRASCERDISESGDSLPPSARSLTFFIQNLLREDMRLISSSIMNENR